MLVSDFNSFENTIEPVLPAAPVTTTLGRVDFTVPKQIEERKMHATKNNFASI